MESIGASITVLVLLLFVFVAAELPDGYAVFKIQQKGVCSTVYCPWYCDRYIDANGCVYCGKCTKPNPYSCPQISCPSLPHFECTTRRGQDGCNVCKCRQLIKPAAQSRPGGAMSEALIASPGHGVQKPDDDVVDVPPLKANPRQCPGPTPLCSRRCHIEKDVRGCERCVCPPLAAQPRPVAAALLTSGGPAVRPVNYGPPAAWPVSRKPPAVQAAPCAEAADAPCARPGVCWRERGADGCYSCRCQDDVAVCPEVKCDFSRCQHVIDPVSGCATGCQCNGQRNDV